MPTPAHGPTVLFAASEMAPLVKTGGLADVAGSLPPALTELGCNVTVVLPHYRELAQEVAPHTIRSAYLHGHAIEIRETATWHGQRVWLVACDELFDRPGTPYQDPDGHDWPDNAERFALFARAVTWLATEPADPRERPDVVHLNDWPTGLAAALLARERPAPPSVFSIHNLAYQGIFDHATFMRLKLPAELWSMEAVEFHGAMSFLKAGIAFADRITTVSPSYAQEIQTAEFGHGLEGLIRHRADVLTGILNGIDVNVWDPATDPHLRARYSATDLPRKQINKRALQATLRLSASDVPLLGVVSRLAHQKGVDLIVAAAEQLLALPTQIAVLGSGDAALERALADLSKQHSDRFAFARGMDEALAHQIEAGADIFLMPSRYEPCGLNQMYSQRYGTVPVVRRTGGLMDTVQPVHGRRGTGFLFDAATPAALLEAVHEAVSAYRNWHVWPALQYNGMQQDFSWRRSATQYLQLYRQMLETDSLW